MVRGDVGATPWHLAQSATRRARASSTPVHEPQASAHKGVGCTSGRPRTGNGQGTHGATDLHQEQLLRRVPLEPRDKCFRSPRLENGCPCNATQTCQKCGRFQLHQRVVSEFLHAGSSQFHNSTVGHSLPVFLCASKCRANAREHHESEGANCASIRARLSTTLDGARPRLASTDPANKTVSSHHCWWQAQRKRRNSSADKAHLMTLPSSHPRQPLSNQRSALPRLHVPVQSRR